MSFTYEDSFLTGYAQRTLSGHCQTMQYSTAQRRTVQMPAGIDVNIGMGVRGAHAIHIVSPWSVELTSRAKVIFKPPRDEGWALPDARRRSDERRTGHCVIRDDDNVRAADMRRAALAMCSIYDRCTSATCFGASML